mmetsp:Transcript_101956/g.328891  ORF Transcript_101956/g.328891 Transcript_101956/m.328891 type:complete len:209 (+) Transcript_101956:337-963(+)
MAESAVAAAACRLRGRARRIHDITRRGTRIAVARALGIELDGTRVVGAAGGIVGAEADDPSSVAFTIARGLVVAEVEGLRLGRRIARGADIAVVPIAHALPVLATELTTDHLLLVLIIALPFHVAAVALLGVLELVLGDRRRHLLSAQLPQRQAALLVASCASVLLHVQGLERVLLGAGPRDRATNGESEYCGEAEAGHARHLQQRKC